MEFYIDTFIIILVIIFKKMYLNLSNSQRLAADKIAAGKNVFITGPAGTGK